MSIKDEVRQAVFGRGPLDRRAYLVAGLALAVGKYAIDAAVIYAAAGVVWTPLDYVFPLVSVGGAKTAAFPASLSVALLIWTLPFIWAGVTMSVRRAQDARISAWLVVAFFLPFLNYILLLVLVAAPRARTVVVIPPHPAPSATGEAPAWALDTTALLAALAGVAVAIVTMMIATLLIKSYGLALFLGTPFLLGLVTGHAARSRRPYTTSQTAAIVCLACIFTVIGIVMFALEGAVCLVMAFPITVPLALLGGRVGHNMAERRDLQPGGLAMALMVVLVPAGSAVERRVDATATRVVMTSVEVDAPPSRVWRHVVSFEEISEPPSWEFRTGLAYPVRARIEGRGAGALRFCEFSTGAFVEPITEWVEPSRLAFDVTDQPPPLQEWSPYATVYAPHLKGFFTTTHGEFRLTPIAGGRTRLEGRTWYALKMAPAIYWNPIADAILHRIHARVLRHVKTLAETEGVS